MPQNVLTARSTCQRNKYYCSCCCTPGAHVSRINISVVVVAARRQPQTCRASSFSGRQRVVGGNCRYQGPVCGLHVHGESCPCYILSLHDGAWRLVNEYYHHYCIWLVGPKQNVDRRHRPPDCKITPYPIFPSLAGVHTVIGSLAVEGGLPAAPLPSLPLSAGDTVHY